MVGKGFRRQGGTYNADCHASAKVAPAGSNQQARCPAPLSHTCSFLSSSSQSASEPASSQAGGWTMHFLRRLRLSANHSGTSTCRCALKGPSVPPSQERSSQAHTGRAAGRSCQPPASEGSGTSRRLYPLRVFGMGSIPTSIWRKIFRATTLRCVGWPRRRRAKSISPLKFWATSKTVRPAPRPGRPSPSPVTPPTSKKHPLPPRSFERRQRAPDVATAAEEKSGIMVTGSSSARKTSCVRRARQSGHGGRVRGVVCVSVMGCEARWGGGRASGAAHAAQLFACTQKGASCKKEAECGAARRFGPQLCMSPSRGSLWRTPDTHCGCRGHHVPRWCPSRA